MKREYSMNEGRMHIDPEGKYPSDGMREAEKNAARVLDMLPGAVLERTRDCIDTHRVHYRCQPFQRETDFCVTSVNYIYSEFLACAAVPR